MRRYIFTETERRRIKAWLEEDVEDLRVRKLFVKVRRNLNYLKRDVELLSAVALKLRREGRLMGLVRLQEESGSR